MTTGDLIWKHQLIEKEEDVTSKSGCIYYTGCEAAKDTSP